jgi:hypothetical protein
MQLGASILFRGVSEVFSLNRFSPRISRRKRYPQNREEFSPRPPKPEREKKVPAVNPRERLGRIVR